MSNTARIEQLTAELRLYHADLQRRLRTKEQELHTLLQSLWHRCARDGDAHATAQGEQHAAPVSATTATTVRTTAAADDNDVVAAAAGDSLDVSPIPRPTLRVRSVSCSPATCAQSNDTATPCVCAAAAAKTATTATTAAITTAHAITGKRVRFSSASPQVALVSVDCSTVRCGNGDVHDDDDDSDGNLRSSMTVATRATTRAEVQPQQQQQQQQLAASPPSSPALLLVRRQRQQHADTTKGSVAVVLPSRLDGSVHDTRTTHTLLIDADDDAAGEREPQHHEQQQLLLRTRTCNNKNATTSHNNNDNNDDNNDNNNEAQTRRWLRDMLARKTSCTHVDGDAAVVTAAAMQLQYGATPNIVLACGPTTYFD